MNIAKLVRSIPPAPRDGLPSTQELLEDPSTSFLKVITSPVDAEVEYAVLGFPSASDDEITTDAFS